MEEEKKQGPTFFTNGLFTGATVEIDPNNIRETVKSDSEASFIISREDIDNGKAIPAHTTLNRDTFKGDEGKENDEKGKSEE